MAYTVDSPNLPGAVQSLSAADKKKWVAAYNASYTACMAKDGAKTAVCETGAHMKAASSVTAKINTAKKGSEAADSGDAGDASESTDAADTKDGESGLSRDFLTRLREKLKDAVDKSAWDAAVKHARGHAGGKAAARNKTAKALKAAEYWDEQLGWVASPDYVEVEPQPSYVEAAPMDDAYSVFTPKYEKADTRVNLRMATQVGAQCASCVQYCYGLCKIVEGTIEPMEYCDLFLPRANLYAEKDGQDPTPVRLFNELASAFAEAPEWVPVLPRPGQYTHASYGTITITPERNAQFVSNFNSGLYQDKVAIDLEHDSKLSGAVGYLTELRLNEDGTADGRAEWTARGTSIIEADSFQYVSPEWYETWQDPATGLTHSDVLVGLALTNRPFFKGNALRPLVATEEGGYIVERETVNEGEQALPIIKRAAVRFTAAHVEEAPAMAEQTPATPITPAPATVAVQFSEEDRTALVSLTEKLTAAEAAQQKYAEDNAALITRLAGLEKEARTKRFTDIVMGRGGEGDGAAWAGNTEKHVAMLESLSTTFGEESEQFLFYVSDNTERAAVASTSEMFREIGRTVAGQTGASGAYARLAVAVQKYQEANPTATKDAATAAVVSADKSLYDAILRENG